jgi:hypothetical protein
MQTFADDTELASKIGVIDTDLTDGAAIVEKLVAADGNQTMVMTERKDKTFDRNSVQLRIEVAVDMISSRGAMAFRSTPEIRKRFSALISSSGPTQKGVDEMDMAQES